TVRGQNRRRYAIGIEGGGWPGAVERHKFGLPFPPLGKISMCRRIEPLRQAGNGVLRRFVGRIAEAKRQNGRAGVFGKADFGSERDISVFGAPEIGIETTGCTELLPA